MPSSTNRDAQEQRESFDASPHDLVAGERRLDDGSFYKGEVGPDGAPHGGGRRRWADGQRYEGAWRAGQKNGRGTHVWSNGDKYVGEWREGKMHGRGKLTRGTGPQDPRKRRCQTGDMIHDGQWRDGSPFFDVAPHNPTCAPAPAA